VSCLIGVRAVFLYMALLSPKYWLRVIGENAPMGLFQAMETGRRGNLGTIYFPITFTILTWLLWGHQPLLVAALMPMTWGDALAAIVGQRVGRHTFSVLGSTRSLEGSLTMLVVAWVATMLPLLLLSGSPFPGWSGVLVALVVAAVATLVEAVSPWGIDNLTVPAVCALALWIAQL
jgi:phytol kinase